MQWCGSLPFCGERSISVAGAVAVAVAPVFVVVGLEGLLFHWRACSSYGFCDGYTYLLYQTSMGLMTGLV